LSRQEKILQLFKSFDVTSQVRFDELVTFPTLQYACSA